MRIKVINPNTSHEMTRSIESAARSCARSGTEIVTVSPEKGPITIENFHDQYVAILGLMEEMHRGIADRFDAFIVAAACDPGVSVAREISTAPVIGIGEASMHLASLVAPRFSVVTALPRIKPLIEEAVKRAGMTERCASIRTTKLSVLDGERKPDQVMDELRNECRKAIDQDGAEAICLGSAGMVKFANDLEHELDVPVFDGVVAAVKLAESLVDLGKRTSKILTYQYPKKKEYKGFPTGPIP